MWFFFKGGGEAIILFKCRLLNKTAFWCLIPKFSKPAKIILCHGPGLSVSCVWDTPAKYTFLSRWWLSTPGFLALQDDLSSGLPQKEINGGGGLQ